MTTIGEIISSTDRLALMQAFDHDEALAHDERTRKEKAQRAEIEAMLQAQMAQAFADLPKQAARQPRVLKNVRREHDIDMADPAPDFFTLDREAEVAAKNAAHFYRLAIQQLDFHPSLEILQLKAWDHVIRGLEQVLAKLEDDWRSTRWKQKAHARKYDGTEFWNGEDLRITQLLNGLTAQGKALAPLIPVLIAERERAVSVSGINFSAYKSLKIIQQDRQKKRLQVEQMEQWAKLSPREKYLRGRRLAGYEPRLDGIDADGGEHEYDN